MAVADLRHAYAAIAAFTTVIDDGGVGERGAEKKACRARASRASRQRSADTDPRAETADID